MVTPDLYKRSKTKEFAAEMRKLLDEARRYFTEEQVVEVFLMAGEPKR
jgi:hypothetical protein